jgi:hypothetical protein
MTDKDSAPGAENVSVLEPVRMPAAEEFGKVREAADEVAPAAFERRPLPTPQADTMAVPNWISAARPRPGTAQNRLFELLVKGDDDLVGLLAYALSEQDRHDWLSAWLASHPAVPSEEQTEAYTAGRALSAQLERYRAGARAALEAYALAAVEFERPLVTEEAVTTRIERAARRVEAGGRWWRNIGGAIVAILVLGIVAVAAYAAIRYFRIDPIAILNSYLPGGP